eukprot:CAMPEP_0170276688 /NCGR_PEP_ID=MMETSP0116_2-20130129/38330_1 /TAXON_ID=400756 /ORGANISM="Durinskia baltica, Strain CSIRO CS-38" /LENGTH=361 /DNA_ID=CAMNT_0010527963 /DNA_START=60 /DNA_END=1141 /DNA_ORIENTATION=+
MSSPCSATSPARRSWKLLAAWAVALQAGGVAGGEAGDWSDFGDGGHCRASLGFDAIRYDPSANRAGEWVLAHNHYRACHGVSDVVWNPTLAAYAKKWVEQLLTHCDGMQDLWDWVSAAGPAVHRPHDGDCYFQHPKNGENIWTGQGVTSDNGYSFEAGAVNSWYQEVTSQCPSHGQSPGCGGMMNHYTAMIWKDVKEIGCYVATVETSAGAFSVASCRYSPGSGADFEGCALPNMQSCEGREVPALVAGECPHMAGSEVSISPAYAQGSGGGYVISQPQWQMHGGLSFGLDGLGLPDGATMSKLPSLGAVDLTVGQTTINVPLGSLLALCCAAVVVSAVLRALLSCFGGQQAGYQGMHGWG